MCSEFYFVLPFNALPFHCFTSQSFASPFPRLSEPVRFVVRASCHFFAFAILCTAERFYSVSTLRSSTPCLGVSAGIVSAPIYSVSAPVPAIPYHCNLLPCRSFSLQSCSVLFRFCCFACPIKSISDQRIAVSFRIYSSQSSSVSGLSFSVRFRSNPVFVQRLHLGATPRHSVSCRASAVSDLLVSGPCTSVAFYMFFRSATQLIVSLCRCLSNARLSNLFRCFSTLFLCRTF